MISQFSIFEKLHCKLGLLFTTYNDNDTIKRLDDNKRLLTVRFITSFYKNNYIFLKLVYYPFILNKTKLNTTLIFFLDI